MPFTIPFHRLPGFRPKTSIPGNDISDAPVTFDLSMAAGPDHARLKSLLSATAGLASPLQQWTPDVQRAVTEALRSSSQLFVDTVDKIVGLSVPAVLARRLSLVVDASRKDDDPVPIESGHAFARVAPYFPALALEIGFEIMSLTVKGAVDPRFFDSRSALPASGAKPNGSATPAQTPSAADATAGSAT
jgi:hypothetical protein